MTPRPVLVVEDDEALSFLCRLFLERVGLAVACAGDGASGLAVARSRLPVAIVLDFMLPDMDGLEVLASLRADPRTALTPVVFLSARADPQDQQVAREAGASDYLTKPVDSSRLAAAVLAAISPGGAPGRAAIRSGGSERRPAPEVWPRLGSIVEGSNDAVIGMDLDGLITSCNRGAVGVFGYESDEVIGRSIATLVPADHAAELAEAVRRSGRGEHVAHFETIGERKDGRRIDVSLSVSPVRGPVGDIDGVAVIGRDVSERSRSDADRSRTDFLSTVAHELRTPLTAIKGFADLLTGDWTGYTDEQKQEFVQRIALACSRLDDHISNLVDFKARRSPPEATTPASRPGSAPRSSPGSIESTVRATAFPAPR